MAASKNASAGQQRWPWGARAALALTLAVLILSFGRTLVGFTYPTDGWVSGRDDATGLVVFDHAVTDGAPVGRFVRRLIELLTETEGLAELDSGDGAQQTAEEEQDVEEPRQLRTEN